MARQVTSARRAHSSARRFSNVSAKPVTVEEAFYQEDRQEKVRLPFPFIKRIQYKTDEVCLTDSISLPLKIDSHATVEFYALIPVSVRQPFGELLLQIMTAKTRITLPSETINIALGEIERHLLSEVKVLGATLTEIKLPFIEEHRPLIKEADGKCTFLDKPDDPRNAFIFYNSTALRAAVSDKAYEENDPSILVNRPPFKEYKLLLTTSQKTYMVPLKFVHFNQVKVAR
jgi:hypothetical protein